VAQLFASVGVDGLDAALATAEIPEARSAVIRDEVRRVMMPDPTAAAPTGDLGAERDARFDAWITALDALAGRAAAWLVEDVHWAGGDLLAFLDRAGADPARFGRVVVATARPSLLESAPDWCDAERVDLGPLPPADAAGLVRALLGAALPDELLAAVVARSDGTPLFIEELLRTWASVGTLVPSEGAWILAVHPTSVTLPPTVQAIYAAQLDDLPPDARTVARRGAVAGRRVPTGAFAALDIPDGAGLAALRRRALLTGPMRDPITGEGWAYRHALLRDAGYASLARAERARLHLAMARWLASVAGSSADAVAEAVAEHLASALDSLPGLVTGELPARAALAGEASAWFERAADAALRLAAIDACCRLTERSIELTAPDERRDLARRRRRLGEVLAASADLDRGIAELEAALACCPDDPESVTASAYALGRAYMQQIRFAEAERLTAETLERSPDAPAAERARLHALHAWSVAAQGATDGVLAEADLADGAAREAGDPELELDVLEHVAAARDEVGAAGEEHWARLEDRARELGRWRQAVSAARSRAIYRGIDDPAGAVPMLEAAGELARARGLTEEAGWVEYQTCETLWLVGAWDDAVRVGLHAVEIAERNAYQRLAFRTFVVLLPLAAARGDGDLVERFRRWWDGAASQLPTSPSPYARLLRAAIEVWQAPADGPVPVAPDETLDAIVPMLNPHFIAAVEAVVSAWLRAGRVDLATRAAERVAGFAADDDATPLMRASGSLLAAWLAGGAGDPDAARRAADAAAGHARGIGAAWWLARALRAGGSDAEAAAIERRLGIG
jgi:tetratricopeptide (TPR) repeat protein